MNQKTIFNKVYRKLSAKDKSNYKLLGGYQKSDIRNLITNMHIVENDPKGYLYVCEEPNIKKGIRIGKTIVEPTKKNTYTNFKYFPCRNPQSAFKYIRKILKQNKKMIEFKYRDDYGKSKKKYISNKTYSTPQDNWYMIDFDIVVSLMKLVSQQSDYLKPNLEYRHYHFTETASTVCNTAFSYNRSQVKLNTKEGKKTQLATEIYYRDRRRAPRILNYKFIYDFM